MAKTDQWVSANPIHTPHRHHSGVAPCRDIPAMFEFKPDYERTQARMTAFWERELIDRPLVQFTLYKPPAAWVPVPVSRHATPAERWTDAQYQAEFALADLSNREFLGDSLPIAWPNLGPEIFSVFYGCRVEFGDYGTSWTAPILDDWAEAHNLRLDWDGPWFAKLHEMTDALLDAGRGKFIVGMTDWHPGGDAVAAFREPQRLAVDMLEHVDEIKRLLVRIADDYYRAYDIFYAKLRAAGQPCTSWTSLIDDGKFYIPSNDFSIMISTHMFEDVFLPGLVDECRFLDRSIYHLDGPGALRHLDAILAIPELDALQFVPGAGNEGFHRWVEVYRRAQAAGKAIQVFCTPADLPLIMQTLDPRGLFLSMSEVPSRAVGEGVLAEMEKWCAQGRF